MSWNLYFLAVLAKIDYKIWAASEWFISRRFGTYKPLPFPIPQAENTVHSQPVSVLNWQLCTLSCKAMPMAEGSRIQGAWLTLSWGSVMFIVLSGHWIPGAVAGVGKIWLCVLGGLMSQTASCPLKHKPCSVSAGSSVWLSRAGSSLSFSAFSLLGTALCPLNQTGVLKT